mmetsp:Transcript_16474/g.28570  ORF Transcript_16474/g.28570 Transcript_16474/m.28570 type:complete len:208 (-) Transcript_16474:622-1245(-)
MWGNICLCSTQTIGIIRRLGLFQFKRLTWWAFCLGPLPYLLVLSIPIFSAIFETSFPCGSYSMRHQVSNSIQFIEPSNVGFKPLNLHPKTSVKLLVNGQCKLLSPIHGLFFYSRTTHFPPLIMHTSKRELKTNNYDHFTFFLKVTFTHFSGYTVTRSMTVVLSRNQQSTLPHTKIEAHTQHSESTVHKTHHHPSVLRIELMQVVRLE